MSVLSNFFGLFGKEDPKGNVSDNEKKQERPAPKQEAPKQEVPKQEVPKDAKSKAHIYNLIIVDESGSMSSLREATLSGVNETIETIRAAQKEFADTQRHWLTLVTFDSGGNRMDVRTMIDCAPIEDVEDFQNYWPSGCTPLYDAIGQSLTALKQHVEGDEDATGVVTVLTDGLENASHEWNANMVRKLIDQLKELGWSFSYMGSAHNVKEVSDLLSIKNVVEFSHDAMGTATSWMRESSAKHAFYDKMHRMYDDPNRYTANEMMKMRQQFAQDYYGNRVSPDNIDTLAENEIFVFGSNAGGQHAGGAAAFAVQNFGAVWGQGEGLQGQSYAIPTMEGLENLQAAVDRFTQFAYEHPELHFLVTRVGCGIAGYSVDQIAPMFRNCARLENVALPEDFWSVLGLIMNF